MKCFNIVGGSPELNEKGKTIPFLTNLSEKEQKFIWYCFDLRSDYHSIQEENRFNFIYGLLEMTEDKTQLFTKLKGVGNQYVEITDSPSRRMYRATLLLQDKLAREMENIDLTETDSRGNKLNPLSSVTQTLKGAADVHASISKLKNMIRTEFEEEDNQEVKVRGNERFNIFEDGGVV